MKKFLLLLCFFALANVVNSQTLSSPETFLGYRLGDKFTPHYRVVEYFRSVAAASKNVKLVDYGKTNEGRPLLLAFIASDENIGRLEEIRQNNLKTAGMLPGTPTGTQPVIVWLSYNVHGNEPVSTEAAMKTFYALVNPATAQAKEWLKNTVVVIDPCINPDGRDRYVNFYNPLQSGTMDAAPFAREHSEPWPGGRTNHYYFDLNRDWAWQTQTETKARMAVFNEWLPQVHGDYHEQGINNPYYFAPAAEPFHEAITPWQREAQNLIGANNARYFDQNGWMYFTREVFDLLYPAYGDTFPIYNGSVGMTFEQGGGGQAGIAIQTASGDTLTLRDRIEHHYTTGISTIETASRHADRFLKGFRDFYDKSRNNPDGVYKTYVIKAGTSENGKTLAALLKKNGIKVGYGAAKGGTGFNYFTGKTEGFTVDKSDLVVTSYQPKSVLARVLLEPRTKVADSVTYDITAWSLPYAYGLNAYATTEVLKPLSESAPAVSAAAVSVANAVAFVANWNSLTDVKFLSALLKRNVKVRYTETPVELNGKKFNAGSLIVTRTGNESLGSRFATVINEIAAAAGATLTPVSTGFADKGPDLGSGSVRYMKKPVIAVLSGEESSSLSVGQVWQFFEQEIGYPVSLINYREYNRMSLDKVNVLVVPEGRFPGLAGDKLPAWIRAGGRVVVLGSSVGLFADQKGFGLKKKEEPKEKEAKAKNPYEELKTYGGRERESVKSFIPGAIFRMELDNTHPLAFGYPAYYYMLKADPSLYRFLENGWNVGVLKKNSYVTGFSGSEATKKLVDGLLLGVEELGSGSIVYLDDDPLFRGFWENGKLLFGNAVFMVGN